MTAFAPGRMMDGPGSRWTAPRSGAMRAPTGTIPRGPGGPGYAQPMRSLSRTMQNRSYQGDIRAVSRGLNRNSANRKFGRGNMRALKRTMSRRSSR